MEKYVFRPYNGRYPVLFETEKERLENVLGNAARIEHVGSTAVEGLGGKGIVDVLIGVEKGLNRAKNALVTAGYEFREKASTPERYFFRRDYPENGGVRRVHLHLTTQGSRDWKRIIAFRDYLRAHPEAVERYAQIKKEAADQAAGKGETYRAYKEQFIEEILSQVL